jgi:hypothetical protein
MSVGKRMENVWFVEKVNKECADTKCFVFFLAYKK